MRSTEGSSLRTGPVARTQVQVGQEELNHGEGMQHIDNHPLVLLRFSYSVSVSLDKPSQRFAIYTSRFSTQTLSTLLVLSPTLPPFSNPAKPFTLSTSFQPPLSRCFPGSPVRR